MPRTNRIRILILLALSVFVYLPALRLPFISDDFGQIPLARQYAAAGWDPLWRNVGLRTRATYMVLDAALDSWFGFTPLPFYAASILLHVACVLLVYAMGAWRGIPPPAAFWAACFFAIYEGHQEAVMWVAASADLLVFLFGMAAWLCWVKWLQRPDWKWYCAALLAFLPGMASKESIWIFPFLMALPLVWDRPARRRGLVGLAPFFALAAVYIVWSWLSRVAGPGYHDMRFSLRSPWPVVVLRSAWRLLLPWGFLALGLLVWSRKREDRRQVWFAMAWLILGIAPFCFLTYMLQIPSRHTYIASAGLALLAGAAACRLTLENRRKLLWVLAATALAYNTEIVWVKKMSQFRERAEPSELLSKAAAEAAGPVYVDCTPLGELTADWVLKDAGAQGVMRNRGPQGDPRCFSVEYTNRAGKDVWIRRELGARKHGAFY